MNTHRPAARTAPTWRGAALALLAAALLLAVLSPRPVQALGGRCVVVEVPVIAETQAHGHGEAQCQLAPTEQTAAAFEAFHLLDPLLPAAPSVALAVASNPALVADELAPASLSAAPASPPPQLSSI